MKLGHIELSVSNPLDSRDFYENILGCEVTTIQNDQFVWLKLGEQEILLRPGIQQIRPPQYDEIHIGMVIYTDALEQDVATMREKGVELHSMPDKCYIFTDPDGNWFQIVDPSDH
ncbi:MAG: VOC family protein [Chloroflexota bacterium]